MQPLAYLLHGREVQAPDFDGVVHARRGKAGAASMNGDAQDLVAMAVIAVEDGHTDLCPHVPESDSQVYRQVGRGNGG